MHLNLSKLSRAEWNFFIVFFGFFTFQSAVGSLIDHVNALRVSLAESSVLSDEGLWCTNNKNVLFFV